MTDQARRRNQLCPCGSGRKSKECCRGRKPREQQFFAMSKPAGEWLAGGVIAAGNSWTFQIADGQVRVFLDGKESPFGPMHVKDSYLRTGKKDKILRQIPVGTFDVRDMLDRAAISSSCLSYDWIFVVDTSTKVIAGKLHSVACSMVCKAKKMEAHKCNFHYIPTNTSHRASQRS